MPACNTTEFFAVIPEGFRDRSVNVYLPPDEDGVGVNFVVARDDLLPGEDLNLFVDRQIQTLTERLPMFRVHRRLPTSVSGQNAISLDYTWHSKQGTNRQRVIALRSFYQAVLVVTVTFRLAPAEDSERLVRSFLESLRLHPAKR